MNLVVVESPAKARKIQGFLGRDFKVVASMGHIRDLPLKDLGVGLEKMEPVYEVHKPDVVERLKRESERAQKVYLCTDPDREGEAIAWHLKEVMSSVPEYHRATFQEVTLKAVKKSISKPESINMDLVDAQQSRRIVDRLVGFRVSRLLWDAFKGEGALSAGRVQSVALRLLVEREREIREFKEEKYVTLKTLHEKEGISFKADLMDASKAKGSKRKKLKDRKSAEDMAEYLRNHAPMKVTSLEKKEQKIKAQSPFTTSDMQAKAAHVLKINAGQSMKLAQKLYEDGLITYHRTDSVSISKEAQEEIRTYILKVYGQDYLPKTQNRYRSKKGAQEAHECIRPTKIELDQPKGLSGDALRLYDLIRRQTLASQMAPGRDHLTIAKLSSGKEILEARGRIEQFDGWRKLIRSESTEKSKGKKDEEEREKQKLPPLEKGETLGLLKIELKDEQTRPPRRYSEATLIKTLEKEGIGRPSTYASILETLKKRSYAELKKSRFFALDIGIRVSDFLTGRFPKVVDVGFTRQCELRLDKIADGELEWKDFLSKFWDYLRVQIDAGRMPLAISAPLCPKCGKTTIWSESQRWVSRFFWCCHSCRSYLETDTQRSPLPGRSWMMDTSQS